MAKKVLYNKNRETVSFSIDLKGGKTANYKIHKPIFSELHAGMTELTTMSGKLDMVGAGLVIFNLCCFEYDDIIDNDEFSGAKLQMCLNLATTYVSDIQYEIKKN